MKVYMGLLGLVFTGVFSVRAADMIGVENMPNLFFRGVAFGVAGPLFVLVVYVIMHMHNQMTKQESIQSRATVDASYSSIPAYPLPPSPQPVTPRLLQNQYYEASTHQAAIGQPQRSFTLVGGDGGN